MSASIASPYGRNQQGGEVMSAGWRPWDALCKTIGQWKCLLFLFFLYFYLYNHFKSAQQKDNLIGISFLKKLCSTMNITGIGRQVFYQATCTCGKMGVFGVIINGQSQVYTNEKKEKYLNLS